MLEKETVDKEARINDDNKDVITEEEYQNASGPVTVGLTNDYMFRVVFQQNKHALKGLIASTLVPVTVKAGVKFCGDDSGTTGSNSFCT